MNQILIISIIFSVTNAFLLNNNRLIPIASKLESIVTTKAILGSFYANLRNEFTVDKLLTVIADFNHYSINNFPYVSMIIIYLYGEYKYMKGSKTTEKLEKIDKYSKNYKNFKEWIYIFIFIFTKDIQHAM